MSAKTTFELSTGCSLSAAGMVTILFWLFKFKSPHALTILLLLLVVIGLLMLSGWWEAFLQLRFYPVIFTVFDAAVR